ncbi:MAG: DUF86 domain-containing protein [Thermodesulfobacteriota bacterium]
MPRDYKVFLEDMLASLQRIQVLTSGRSYDDFARDLTIQEAVIRNLEIIGEAAKSVPNEVRLSYPEIDWARMGGLRDILIHQYFAVDLEIVWDIILNNLPDLEVEIKRILSEQV